MAGVYFFAGGFLSAITVVTLATLLTRDDRALFGWWATKHHQHNLGKLMLAFTAFWAYIGFSQFMLASATTHMSCSFAIIAAIPVRTTG